MKNIKLPAGKTKVVRNKTAPLLLRLYKLLICLGIALCFFAEPGMSQDLLKSANLSTINVDNLSDADISKFQSQLQSGGISLNQAEQIALQKGMPQAEFNKLRGRLSKIQPASATMGSAQVGVPDREQQISDYKTFAKKTVSSGVFGSLLFSTPSLSFEPNLRIALPPGYIVGPDDELMINVSGYQEAAIRAPVLPEGNVLIPQVGSVSVTGLTIEEATKRIRSKMEKTAYPNITRGLTQVSVTLTKIRSIHVTILGAIKPGNYTVSSFTTVFNSLYQSGGPDEINSFRKIELIRDNKLYRKIDLYKFLVKGDQSDNISLRDNDLINIPVYGIRVKIAGEVKRPGIYELLEGETLDNLLSYAAGFTEKAYTASVKIKQFTETERRIKDLPRSGFSSYQPGNGDSIVVEAVLERLDNSVTISGAVLRPGEYELNQNLTLNSLIKKAGGIAEDAYLGRAILVRTHEDKTQENISFSLKDLVNGTIPDIALQKKDSVYLAPVSKFNNSYTVKIEGEVRIPGDYPYQENLSFKDLLFMAGNFSDAASVYRVEIARRINSDADHGIMDTLADVFDINTDRDLSVKGEHLLLKPFDVVTVRKKPGYIEQKQVTINGEVLYPGVYTIQNKKERISDLFRRSGGLSTTAFAGGVSLVRNYKYDVALQQDKISKAKVINKGINDTSTTVLEDISQVNAKIAIDMDQVLQHPGSKEDYILEEGDLINVPKFDPLVKISGEVFQSTKTSFEANASLGYYLVRAGGTTDNARLSKTYVLYSNGQIGKTRNFFFGIFRTFPRIKPGSEIVVPRKMEKRKLTVGETVGLTSAFLSLVSLIIVTITSLK